MFSTFVKRERTREEYQLPSAQYELLRLGKVKTARWSCTYDLAYIVYVIRHLVIYTTVS